MPDHHPSRSDTVLLPEGAEHICTYVCHFGIDSDDLAVYLVRDAEEDRAWAVMAAPTEVVPGPDGPLGVVGRGSILFYKQTASAPRAGSKTEAARRLLAQNVRSGAGAGWPTRFVAPGILDETAFEEVIHDVEEEQAGRERQAEAERARARAAEREPVIEEAAELGLLPDPTRSAPQAWKAQCPGGHHWLRLDSRTNLFYCGYCRRGGGPEDLRRFAREKRGRGA